MFYCVLNQGYVYMGGVFFYARMNICKIQMWLALYGLVCNHKVFSLIFLTDWGHDMIMYVMNKWRGKKQRIEFKQEQNYVA